MSYIGDFEVAVAREARRRGADGVICGHIHHAEMRDIDGVLYCNDGDWVESLTALVEHADGQLEILDWSSATRAASPSPTTAKHCRRRACAVRSCSPGRGDGSPLSRARLRAEWP